MRKKKPERMKCADALRRLDQMIEHVLANAQIASSLNAAFQAANDIVVEKYKGGDRFEAHCYHSIMNSLALNLAITLARLFDAGSKLRHPNKRDVASIPLLLRLLRQKRCRRVLVERARSWPPKMPDLAETNAATCEHAIQEALATYASLRRKPKGRKAVAALKEFRDKRLAHSLLVDLKPKLETRYGHLFLLAYVARVVAESANLAITGRNIDMKGTEEEYRRRADAFWMPALSAAFEPRGEQEVFATATDGYLAPAARIKD
jgi:hypothetical protein